MDASGTGAPTQLNDVGFLTNANGHWGAAALVKLSPAGGDAGADVPTHVASTDPSRQNKMYIDVSAWSSKTTDGFLLSDSVNVTMYWVHMMQMARHAGPGPRIASEVFRRLP